MTTDDLPIVAGPLGEPSNIDAKEDGLTTVDFDRELKAKHRAVWASGDYPAVAAELIPALGPEFARPACAPHHQDRC